MIDDSLLNEYNKLINHCYNGNHTEFFRKLRQLEFTKVELMIADSAIKNITLQTLDKTLLLTENSFTNLIEDSISKLLEFDSIKLIPPPTLPIRQDGKGIRG